MSFITTYTTCFSRHLIWWIKPYQKNGWSQTLTLNNWNRCGFNSSAQEKINVRLYNKKNVYLIQLSVWEGRCICYLFKLFVTSITLTFVTFAIDYLRLKILYIFCFQDEVGTQVHYTEVFENLLTQKPFIKGNKACNISVPAEISNRCWRCSKILNP